MRARETQKKIKNGQIQPYLIKELNFNSDYVKIITQGSKSRQELVRRIEFYNKISDGNKLDLYNFESGDSIKIKGNFHEIVDILAQDLKVISNILQNNTHKMLEENEKSGSSYNP